MQLSIITINYNNKSGLEETIKSVVSQKYSDFQYIVIDGGSTDGSVDVIKKYSDKISYWISESDKGVYNAMNKGILQAKGEYVLFMNSGDLLKEDISIGRIFDQTNGEDVVYLNVEIVSPNQEPYVKKYPAKLDLLFFIVSNICHQSTFIKRNLFSKYGLYSETMLISSDWAFFLDVICKYRCSYKYIDECLSVFFIGGISSLEENYDLIYKERDACMKENHEQIYTLYKEWESQRSELHKLRCSKSINWLKKMGFLKWFRVYSKE